MLVLANVAGAGVEGLVISNNVQGCSFFDMVLMLAQRAQHGDMVEDV